MKKGMLLALLAALFCTACAAPKTAEVFYVEDTLPQPVAEPVFSIIFGLPVEAALAETSEDGRVRRYAPEDGSYWIETAICPGVTADRRMQELTGKPADALHPIRTTAMGMNEYRFCWCAGEGEQTTVCTGAVYEDADCCYSLVFSVPEQSARDCRDTQLQVVGSFSLYEDEGF